MIKEINQLINMGSNFLKHQLWITLILIMFSMKYALMFMLKKKLIKMTEKKLKKLIVFFQDQSCKTWTNKIFTVSIMKILMNKNLVKRKDGFVGEFTNFFSK